MALELEAKFRVSDFRAVQRALEAAGAVYRGTAIESDAFFDTPKRDLYHSDKGLRLRKVHVLEAVPGGVTNGWLLTYKGPRDRTHQSKLREEIQTNLVDGEAMGRILREAGLELFLRIEKRRISYALDCCLVELDELPVVGCFVEIEAPSQAQLEAVRQRLALSSQPLADSYPHLIEKHCHGDARGYLEVTFERFAADGP